MNTEKKVNDKVLVKAVQNPVQLDRSCIPGTEAIIQEYADKGVILEKELEDGSLARPTLDDDVFLTTNELSTCTLDFTQISKEDYEKNWLDFFGIAFADFFIAVKCGIFCLLGAAILTSLRNLILDLVCFVKASPEKAPGLKYRRPALLLDILLRLPVPPEKEKDRDRLAFWIESAMEKRKGARRSLPDFESVFTLLSVFNRYWTSGAAKKNRYYPLRLFLKITGVVPLRPVEFLVTPWECLRFSGGVWHLTLRRSRLKGRHASVGYSIAEDFLEVEYRIPEDLATEILEYKKMAAGYERTCLGTLLSPGMRYAALDLDTLPAARYYTYAALVQDIHLFYEEVMKDYGYQMVEDDELPSLKQGMVRIIRPGDTRHLAAINLVESGIPIQLAQLIMHHSDPNMTAHYAGNLNTYAETAVKSSYSEHLETRVAASFDFSGYGVSIPADAPYVEMDDGRCYSPNFLNKNAEDCVRSKGPGGQLGWCASCGYFRNKNPHLVFMDTSRYLENARDDWKLLLETVECYRKDYAGMEETLAQVLTNAQDSMSSFRHLIEHLVGNMDEGRGGNGED